MSEKRNVKSKDKPAPESRFVGLISLDQPKPEDLNILSEDEKIFEKFQFQYLLRDIPLDKLVEAPPEWNFFRAPQPDQYRNLKESIMEFGLFHPIFVVEKVKDEKYMIISGHTRYRVFKELLEETGDKKYKAIAARIIKDIDDGTIEVLISYGNYTHRTLDENEKRKSLNKISEYNKKVLGIKNKSENIMHISSTTGTNTRTIRRDLDIEERLIDEIKNMYDSKIIEKNAAERLAPFSSKDQKWLYDEFGPNSNNFLLTSKNILKINRKMERETIRNILLGKELKAIEVCKITIPEKLLEDVKKLIKAWELANRTTFEFKIEKVEKNAQK